MKTLILSALKGEQLPSLEGKLIQITEKKIKSCLGCGVCAKKRPDYCVLKDDMQQIIQAIIEAEILVFLSPIFLGTVTPELKQVIDRFMPLMESRYCSRNGELHFTSRYSPPRLLLGIGITSPEEAENEELFSRLIQRHGLNLNARESRCIILKDPAELKGAIL